MQGVRNTNKVMETKKCSKCGVEYGFSFFQKCKLGKFGLRAECNKCRAYRMNQKRKENPEKEKVKRASSYTRNKEKICEKKRLFTKNNPEIIKEKNKNNYLKHGSKYRQRQREYYINNKLNIRTKRNESVKQLEPAYLKYQLRKGGFTLNEIHSFSELIEVKKIIIQTKRLVYGIN